jgi:23S rRNA (cytosine1962-C5)-methyltransferase
LIREERRGSRYDAIILDPPSFGRGSKGELFKIELDIVDLLNRCRTLLSEQALFVLFSCHTPGFSPLVMEHLLMQTMQGIAGQIKTGEMVLEGNKQVLSVPSGTYAKWEKI